MRWKPTWKEWIVIGVISLNLAMIFSLIFPPYILANRHTPLVELHRIQQLGADADAKGKPLAADEIGKTIKSLGLIPPGYQSSVVGTGQNWMVIFAKQKRRTRYDELFVRSSFFDIEMCMLSAHNPNVVIVDATGATRFYDISEPYN